MSLQTLLQQAVAGALADHEAFGVVVNGIFDAPPVRAALPYALIDETVLTDWSTKDMAGREGRIRVVVFDEGERPLRLRTLADAGEAALEAMPRALGEGWRVASLVFLRRHIVRDDGIRWAAVSEFRVRMLRES